MPRTFAVSMLAVALTAVGTAFAHASRLASPNGRIVIVIELEKDAASIGQLAYSVEYRGRPILGPSRLGLDLDDGPLGAQLEIVGEQAREHDADWKPVYGERATIPDRYHSLGLQLREAQAPHRRLDVEFRAYDEGVAFRYTLPARQGQKRARIVRERTEFRFLADHTTWAVYSAQGKYERVRLSQLKPRCERPLTVEVDARTYAAVAEARLVDYARMRLSPVVAGQCALTTTLDGEVAAELPLATPWRVILLAESPGQLLEQNYLLLNLNDPCAIADTSWIKPGKVIREVTLTTDGGKACVDFAVRRKLQFVEFDAGWYGHEYSDESDATAVHVDPRRSAGPLDLPEVLRYARDRGVGVILYVNRRALERQLDELLPLYRRWGVSGVKYGFVQVGSQEVTSWLHSAVRQAAAQRLMVDIHDEYRPTGYSRTYPNLMTQEGIAGDETSPSNALTCAILFTRMLAGAADNTICYYDSRVDKNASHAYQLAKAVCLYSPWQFLYWYDRPAAAPRRTGGAGGEQRRIGAEPELEFWDEIPTVWDETKVLEGRIGECAVVARRSGARWFVGGMNSGTARSFRVPLSFLAASQRYQAVTYTDDATVASRTRVRLDRRDVAADTVLSFAVAATGGFAIRISPVR